MDEYYPPEFVTFIPSQSAIPPDRNFGWAPDESYDGSNVVAGPSCGYGQQPPPAMTAARPVEPWVWGFGWASDESYGTSNTVAGPSFAYEAQPEPTMTATQPIEGPVGPQEWDFGLALHESHGSSNPPPGLSFEYDARPPLATTATRPIEGSATHGPWHGVVYQPEPIDLPPTMEVSQDTTHILNPTLGTMQVLLNSGSVYDPSIQERDKIIVFEKALAATRHKLGGFGYVGHGLKEAAENDSREISQVARCGPFTRTTHPPDPSQLPHETFPNFVNILIEYFSDAGEKYNNIFGAYTHSRFRWSLRFEVVARHLLCLEWGTQVVTTLASASNLTTEEVPSHKGKPQRKNVDLIPDGFKEPKKGSWLTWRRCETGPGSSSIAQWSASSVEGDAHERTYTFVWDLTRDQFASRTAFTSLYALCSSIFRFPHSRVVNSFEGHEVIQSVLGPMAQCLSAVRLFAKTVVETLEFRSGLRNPIATHGIPSTSGILAACAASGEPPVEPMGFIFGPVFSSAASAENDGMEIVIKPIHVPMEFHLFLPDPRTGKRSARMRRRGARGHGFPLGYSGEDCVWANPNGDVIPLRNHIVNMHLGRMLNVSSPAPGPTHYTRPAAFRTETGRAIACRDPGCQLCTTSATMDLSKVAIAFQPTCEDEALQYPPLPHTSTVSNDLPSATECLTMTEPTPFVVTNTLSKVYYRGLPSKPRLIATTRPGAFEFPTGPEAYPILKELRPLGDHPLISAWDHGLADRLRHGLNSIRQSSSLVIVWIGIEFGALSFEEGSLVALECRKFIDTYGIHDYHVEIRESRVMRQVGNRFLDPVLFPDPTFSARDPYTALLGIPISAKDRPWAEGTGGFYLSAGGDDKAIYLVTARHVVLPLDDNKEYERKNERKAREDVMVLGTSAFNNKLAIIDYEIKGHQVAITDAKERIELVEDMDDPMLVREAEQDLQKAERGLEALRALRHEIATHWVGKEKRVFGTLTWAPPIIFSTDPGQYTLDLAVIKIDAGKLDTKNYRGNTINIGKGTHAGNSWTRPGPENALVKPPMLDANGESCLIVFKNGAKTDMTIGKANSVSSYTRTYLAGEYRESREWPVIPTNKDSGAFSAKGDSGSCVTDVFGRVAGILTSGSGATDSSDVTYVTPISFIMKVLHETKRFQHAHLNPVLT
ncbi:hypothetical protein BS47DRAFT_1359377 [Hydnum rufescens UP504]|uniref:Uncharacterized protein n=1 Tax=Hydnum rufescens UP504 TaxID=1448309 RepID=A0A9P6B6J1_9AGAM|nr:hypothetical protein BS47DRAFT_1359377 [Hydnum rufescens UP504]